MNSRALKTLYRRELVHLLRDRHTLIYSVAIPIFLYPGILFCIFQSMVVVRGWKERQTATVCFPERERFPLLARLLEEHDGLTLVEPGAGTAERDAAALEELVRSKRVDAAIDVETAGGAAAPGVLRILFSSVRDASAVGEERIRETLDEYREQVLLGAAARAGRDASFLEVLEVEEIDVASGEKKANYLLSLTMPLLMVVIILMGAFYPALDATVGERERMTIETTLVAPVSRLALVCGKYLAVVSVATMAFGLNFLSMTFSFKHLISQVKVSAFSISFLSMAVILAGALLLAALLAALMMAIAFLARSFKEGQSYMAPLYLLGIAPVAVAMSPDVSLTPLLAATPIVNVTLLFRDVLQSRIEWPLVVSTLAFSAFWTAVALCTAAWVVSRESFLLGDGRSLQSRLSGVLSLLRRRR